MKRYRIVLGLALVAGVSGVPASVFGQATPRQESPIAAARRVEVEALTALNVAKRDRDKARAKVVAAYKAKDPEYAKTEAALEKAKRDEATAKATAQAKVRSLPDYRAATAAKAAAQEKFNALRDERGPTAEREKNALLDEVRINGSTVTRLETAALTNDAPYADAKLKVAELTKAMDGFKTQIDDACRVDPEHTQAETAVATAEQTHLTAKEAVVQAQKAAGDASRAAAAARSAASKSKSSAGN